MALGALSAVLPVGAAMALVEIVPAGCGNPDTSGRAWLLVATLIVTLFCSQVLGMGGYIVSRRAGAALVEHVRQRQITKLLAFPLVWFSRNASCRVKEVVQDDLAKVHYLIAHAIPDFVNGTARPPSAPGCTTPSGPTASSCCTLADALGYAVTKN